MRQAGKAKAGSDAALCLAAAFDRYPDDVRHRHARVFPDPRRARRPVQPGTRPQPRNQGQSGSPVRFERSALAAVFQLSQEPSPGQFRAELQPARLHRRRALRQRPADFHPARLHGSGAGAAGRRRARHHRCAQPEQAWRLRRDRDRDGGKHDPDLRHRAGDPAPVRPDLEPAADRGLGRMARSSTRSARP